MNIYIILFILIAILSVISNAYKTNHKKLNNILFWLVVFSMIMLLTLRDVNVGNDTYVYKYYFNLQLLSEEVLYSLRFENGFVLLNYLAGRIFDKFNFFLLIISLISILPITYTIKKYSSDKLLSILCFISLNFYSFMFSGLRQSIAFSICFYSYKFIVEKKPIKFILTIVFASLFHASALIFLIAYPLKKIEFSKKNIFILFLICIGVYFLKIPIYNYMVKYIYKDYQINLTNSFLWMIMCIMIFATCLTKYKKIVLKKENYKTIYAITFIGIVCLLFSSIADNIARIANYFYMFIILLIPEFVTNIHDKKLMIFVYFVTYCILFMVFLFLLYVDGYSIVPYRFN